MRIVRIASIAAVLALAGCGGPARPVADDATTDPGTSAALVEAHPFAVGEVPAGWTPVIAGRGSRTQDWGDDTSGTTEPFTVLEGEGEATAIVASTGFAGYQGGLRQASAGYGPQTSEELEIDGALAYYTPAAGDAWADLVVQRGPDVAIRASAPDASRDELVALAGSAEPAADGLRAPSVVDPPDGWSVVGSVGADVLLGLLSGVVPGSGSVPGPQNAYAAGWAAPSGSLSVMTLPSDAVDLDALARSLPELTGHEVDVDGRPGVLVVWRPWWAETAETRQTAVISHDATGAVTMVVAGESTQPAEDELIVLSATIAETDEATWEAFVVEQGGGPDLQPSAGAIELERGTTDGVEWLLQTHEAQTGEVADDLTEADPCLRLASGRVVCADSSFSGGVGDAVYVHDADSTGFPSFIVVTTTIPGAALRGTASDGSVTRAVLHPIPGTDRAGAVMFFDADPAPALACPWDPIRPGSLRIEVVDADDVPADACLGTR